MSGIKEKVEKTTGKLFSLNKAGGVDGRTKLGRETSGLSNLISIADSFNQPLIAIGFILLIVIEILFWIFLHDSFIWIMFASNLFPTLILFAAFAGLFVGFKRAFLTMFSIVGFYLLVIVIVLLILNGRFG